MSLFGSGLGSRGIQSHVASRSGGGASDERTGFRPGLNPELGGSAGRRAHLERLARGGGFQSDFARQLLRREKARTADLSGFRPGLNPELGPGFTRSLRGIENAGRITQQNMIQELFGGPRDTAGARLGRGISDALRSLLGVSLEGAVHRPSGTFGVRGKLDPISLVGGFQTFGGTLTALHAIATGAVPLLTGAAALSDALQSGGQLKAAGNLINISLPLGFRPTLPEHLVSEIVARGQRVGRGNLTETERFAFDFAQEQAQAQGVERGGDNVPAARFGALGVRTATPAGTGVGQAIVTRNFRRARGADTQSDLDLLRTQRQADVAAGVAPPRPTVLNRGPRTRIL